MPKRELTLRFITSYSVTLTDGSSVASALVTEVVFSGMGPLYAPVGSTEPVSSVEPIRREIETNYTQQNNSAPYFLAALLVVGILAFSPASCLSLAAVLLFPNKQGSDSLDLELSK